MFMMELLSENSKQFTLYMSDRILNMSVRSSPPEVFLGKGALKIYSKFTGEHPCRSVISIKLQN